MICWRQIFSFMKAPAMPLHLDTPLFQSRKLSLLSGRDVWLKLDALQPSGSFKLRGIGAACEEYKRQGKTAFVSSSGGNAGLAVAYAGRLLGVPVTVVVPESTTLYARELLEQEEAKVIVHGKTWVEANDLARSLQDESTALLHPFDDPLLWTGHATLIDEVVKAGAKFDGVILSVGGGGLLSGMVEGLDRNGLSHLPVIAVETKGADSLANALAAGENITLPAITSVATSLAASRVADHAFALAQKRKLRSVTVTDDEALEACERFLHDHRVLVEPACGASLAIAYSKRHHSALEGIGAPLVVICGGATTTLEKIRELRAASGSSK
jgi:L-serine/L-threonine ammonia-lyase